MGRLVKCYGERCESQGIKHDSDIMQKISGKRYCPECYAEQIEIKRQKDKLFQYIKQVYGIPFVTPLMQKHIKEMRQNGLSYKKIYALINYCYEIKKGFTMPDQKYGLIILGNYYNEMMQYYKDKKRQKENNIGKTNKERTVVINEQSLLINKYKDDLTIDMEDL